MKDLRLKLLTVFVTCMLLLSIFSVPAIACGGGGGGCPPCKKWSYSAQRCVPKCTGCYDCVDGGCVCNKPCCDDGDCPVCEGCSADCACECTAECGCEGKSCPTCESCNNCACVCTAECGCEGRSCPDCYDCVDCECEYQCSASECCDNGTCVPECTNTGQCSYDPPTSNYVTCENFNPTDKTCEDIIEGALCGHVINLALSDAECAPCAPDCDMPRISACAEIIPVFCKTRCFLLVCACLCDDAGEPYYSGDHYECN